MKIQDCLKGLRVTHKSTGQVGTIMKVDPMKMIIDIEFDNGTSAAVHPQILDPLPGAQSAQPSARIPTRPCPECAQPIPISATSCPACGYQYQSKESKPMSGVLRFFLAILVLAGIVFIVWKLFFEKTSP